MTNFEKIKKMSLDELATLLDSNTEECAFCIEANAKVKNDECSYNCKFGHIEWLKKEITK